MGVSILLQSSLSTLEMKSLKKTEKKTETSQLEKMNLSQSDKVKYQQCQTFEDLTRLNIEFLTDPSNVTSPFTLRLEKETLDLIPHLLEINESKLLTTSSSSSFGFDNTNAVIKKRAFLTGIIYGWDRAEKLESVLNTEQGIVAFLLPCKQAGYNPDDTNDDMEEIIPDTVDLPQFPVSFEKTEKRLEVKDYITCFNWWTLLKPVLRDETYVKLAQHCYNVYIVDTSQQNHEKFFSRMVQLLQEA